MGTGREKKGEEESERGGKNRERNTKRKHKDFNDTRKNKRTGRIIKNEK